MLDSRYNYHRSKAITRDLEEKYNLHKADRKQRQADNPLRKVDVSQGNVKKQVANTVKSLCATYRFQSLGEYRALLSLYNISLNPHPDDVLTDMEMENIAREYLERMGDGNQPYMV